MNVSTETCMVPIKSLEALRRFPSLVVAEVLAGALVLIEDRWRAILGEHLPDAVVRGRVLYFNYNRGKLQGADLITPDDPRWQACSTQ